MSVQFNSLASTKHYHYNTINMYTSHYNNKNSNPLISLGGTQNTIYMLAYSNMYSMIAQCNNLILGLCVEFFLVPNYNAPSYILNDENSGGNRGGSMKQTIVYDLL